MSPQDEQHDDQREDHREDPRDERPPPQQVTYRRRPQVVSFIVVGAIVGLVIGASLGFFGPASQSSSRGQDVVLLGAVGAVFGALIASVVYLVADWASMRRTR